MKILLFQGKSLISWAIRWQTRSKYSHVAIQLDDGSVIEAWHKGGVRHVPSISTLHKKGTSVDIYSIQKPFVSSAAETWLLKQVGKKYDYGAVARFISRRNERADDKWFCSELGVTAVDKGGCILLNGIASHLSPRDVGLSPRLKFERTEIA